MPAVSLHADVSFSDQIISCYPDRMGRSWSHVPIHTDVLVLRIDDLGFFGLTKQYNQSIHGRS